MATTYRGTAKDNYHRNDGMLSPVVKFSAPRDSKRLAAEATAAFIALLARTTPEEGATAYLEVVRPREFPQTLVKYSGKPTERNERGRAVRGKWFLEEDVPGYSFPEFVIA